MTRELRVGLIGTGFMGRTHTFGYATASKAFDLPVSIVLDTVADVTDEAARAAARRFGYERSTSNWRDIVEDPRIDIVNVTAPNAFHKEMAIAAIAAGKHVYCEKPLAPLASDALEMTEAAEKAGVRTQVGFNYLCNPILPLAREIIASGELGEIRVFRGIHAEDYMTDADAPFTFRHDVIGGGAFADLGSHALATAEFLLGPVTRLMGDCLTVIDERPSGTGRRKVEVDDVGRAFLRFANGASGSVEASWVSTGRKMQHDFEVYGTKGGLSFSGERLNELNLYSSADPAGKQGYRRILSGPDNPPYGDLCVAPGHQLGFNELKAFEVAGYLRAILGEADEPFNFRAGWRIQSLVEAVHRSSREQRWLDV